MSTRIRKLIDVLMIYLINTFVIVHGCLKLIHPFLHFRSCIFKLMDVLIIYLISTFVYDFVFKTYTSICTF